jgi:hypothetical protein
MKRLLLKIIFLFLSIFINKILCSNLKIDKEIEKLNEINKKLKITPKEYDYTKIEDDFLYFLNITQSENIEEEKIFILLDQLQYFLQYIEKFLNNNLLSYELNKIKLKVEIDPFKRYILNTNKLAILILNNILKLRLFRIVIFIEVFLTNNQKGDFFDYVISDILADLMALYSKNISYCNKDEAETSINNYYKNINSYIINRNKKKFYSKFFYGLIGLSFGFLSSTSSLKLYQRLKNPEFSLKITKCFGFVVLCSIIGSSFAYYIVNKKNKKIDKLNIIGDEDKILILQKHINNAIINNMENLKSLQFKKT